VLLRRVLLLGLFFVVLPCFLFMMLNLPSTNSKSGQILFLLSTLEICYSSLLFMFFFFWHLSCDLLDAVLERIGRKGSGLVNNVMA
jgi:hypothetical protein